MVQFPPQTKDSAMSQDETRRQLDRTLPESAREAEERRTNTANQAGLRMLSEVQEIRQSLMPSPNRTEAQAQAERPATALSGEACRNQPQPGQIPVLEPGRRTAGCNFAAPNNSREQVGSLPEFNTHRIYQQAQRENVHLHVGLGRAAASGSGVVVGRSESQCFVATANHVVSPNTNEQVTSRSAQFANGSRYAAQVELRDRSRDLAIVSVNTGADTPQVCHPARISEGGSPIRGAAAVATGFPEETSTLHASPGRVRGLPTARQLWGRNIEPGENPTRPILDLAMQVRPGNSGGPVYNERGEVQGLMYAIPGGNGRASRARAFATPLHETMVQGYMDRIGAPRW